MQAKLAGQRQRKFQEWYNNKKSQGAPVKNENAGQKEGHNKVQMKDNNRTNRVLGKRNHPNKGAQPSADGNKVQKKVQKTVDP